MATDDENIEEKLDVSKDEEKVEVQIENEHNSNSESEAQAKESNETKEENNKIEEAVIKPEENQNNENNEINENKKNESEESNSTIQEEKSNNQENKKDDSKPEYAKEMIKKRKRRVIIIVITILIILVLALFSTVFALLNTNSQNIAKGIYIKGIDVSGLSVSQAKEKVKKATDIELQSVVRMEYNDYSSEIEPSAFEFSYNIDKAIDKAYNVGREGNLIQNNYEILFSLIAKRNIDIEETYNKDLLGKTIDDVSVKIPGVTQNPSYYIETEENTLIIVKGKDGVTVKKDELEKEIIKSIKQRNSEKLIAGEKAANVSIPVQNTKAEKIDIDKIYSEVKKDPVDAYLVEEPFELHPEVNGTDFDITIEEAKAIVSEEKEEYEIPLKSIPASYTVYDIGMEAFPFELSVFTTRYDATNYNRTNNLELAAGKINGTILMPGEVFSYNQVVGKRTIEAGYKNAAIYTNGGVEDGLGGGICQISSTLYNAVLLANLDIVERDNHMFKTSYINVGRDATVVYGSIDFQFVNSRKYPIRIEADVSGGIVTMSIHGILEDVEYEVEIIPEITSTIPYSVIEEEDYSLEPGQEVVKQGGMPGYRVTTYKQLILNGEVVSSEVISNDTYSPMNRIIRVGAGTASTSSTADEPEAEAETTSEAETEQVPASEPAAEAAATEE